MLDKLLNMVYLIGKITNNTKLGGKKMTATVESRIVERRIHITSYKTISISVWCPPDDTEIIDDLVTAGVVRGIDVSPTYEPDGMSVHFYTHY